MNRRLLILFLGLWLPLPVSAQNGRGGGRPPLSGPVEVLLTHRAELRLAPAQVERLEEIEREMEAANREPVMRLIALRRGMGPRPRDRELTPAEREERRRTIEQIRPLLEEIRKNNRAAMAKVGTVLTPVQKDQLRNLLKERFNRDAGRNGTSGRRRAPG